MQKPSSTDIKILFTLALPLMLSGLIEGSVGFFSTIFLAHLGKATLAAGALVAWLFATIMVVMWGSLTSVSVLVSRKHGEKDDIAISLILRDSLILSCIITLPVFILLWHLPPLLLLLGQKPEVVVLSTAYLHGLAWGIWPDFLGLVLLQFLIGLGHTRTNMCFSLLLVTINIALNYILIFGKLGLPALGIAGIGWGTSIGYWLIALFIFAYLFSRAEYRYYLKHAFILSPLQYLKDIIKIGLPMGGMYCLELGFFLTLTLFMGFLGSNYLAANQITLQFMGQLTTVSFAIAGAVTVRMGHTLGAQDPLKAERAAYAGVLMATVFMGLAAMCYWFLPRYLIGIDFDVHAPQNQTLVKLSTMFLAISAMFQIMEAIRISFYGALRALQDTHFTFLTSIISFWGISMPLGYIFAVILDWQGMGAWCGMLIGATCGALILFQRFKYKMRQSIARE